MLGENISVCRFNANVMNQFPWLKATMNSAIKNTTF